MSGYCLLGMDGVRFPVAQRELLGIATLPKVAAVSRSRLRLLQGDW